MSNVPSPADHDRDIRRARAEGYVEALTDVLDLARHAWSVERDEATRSFYWTCTCGDTVVQSFGGEMETIRGKLMAHITEAEIRNAIADFDPE